jgi:hypothetical protein
MAHYRRSLRRFLLIGVCIASALVGLAAVWLFAPSGFLWLDTSDLVAVCALVLLPVLTIVAARADRQAQAAAAPIEPDVPAPALPELEPVAGQRVARKSVIHEPAYLPDPAPERV